MSIHEAPSAKVAVVTGGSSGIGRAAALRIAERGAGVILTYNSNPEGAKETVATIEAGGGEAGGGEAVAVPLDVGHSGSFADFARQVAGELHDRWQRDTFDYPVDNAGFGQMAMFADTTALGRIGEPDDIGKIITALLSDDLGWITGENIETSGGFRM
jgi:NAD(P)-dependent dehydrogenase (short-subunit alcohol dehydrogenase family)